MKLKTIVKKGLATALVLAMSVGAFAGCGAEKETETEVKESSSTVKESSVEKEPVKEEAADEEPVTITWFRNRAIESEDEQMVEDAINEYILPLINVQVDIMNDQNNDLTLALAAGEDIDLFHAEKNPIKNYIRDNACLDITEIVKEYPELYNTIPESVWEAAKWSDGRNYHVPVYKESAQGWGLTVTKEAVEKFGWDISQIKELYDLTPYLKEAYEAGYDSPMCSSSLIFQHFHFHKLARVEVSTCLVYRDNPDKIVNLVETDEYRNYCELIYDWNQKGYINQDELVSNNNDIPLAQKMEDGRSAFGVWTNVPGGEAIAANRYNKDVICINITGNHLTTWGSFGSNYCISPKSDKVDACMKFLTLLYTDRTLADLACYGIEGEHYTRTEDGKVQQIKDSGYRYSGVWAVDHIAAPSLMVGEADNKVELYEEFNANAKKELLAGFIPDTSMIEAELAALNAIDQKYQLTLGRGFYDPDVYIDEYIKEQKAAGIDKVVAEMQKQYDEWRANK